MGVLPFRLGDLLEEYSLDGELPDIVVPGTGLSLSAMEGAIRSLFGNRRHRLSGEVAMENDRLWLFLRVDKQASYRSKYGRHPQNPDSLFEEAAPSIVEAMRPRVVFLSETDPEKLLEIADRTIARLPRSNDDAILAYVVKSQIYRQRREYAEATELLRTAMALAPRNPSPTWL